MPDPKDRFASWLTALPITWWMAERGFMSARLIPLCIARNVAGLPIRWSHLIGRVGVMDDFGCCAERAEDCRHG